MRYNKFEFEFFIPKDEIYRPYFPDEQVDREYKS